MVVIVGGLVRIRLELKETYNNQRCQLQDSGLSVDVDPLELEELPDLGEVAGLAGIPDGWGWW